MTERELANMAQRAQIQATGIAATRLHVVVPIYVELLRHMAGGTGIDPDDWPRACDVLAKQAVAQADGLLRALGLIA